MINSAITVEIGHIFVRQNVVRKKTLDEVIQKKAESLRLKKIAFRVLGKTFSVSGFPGGPVLHP
jgi:hypothetical protein